VAKLYEMETTLCGYALLISKATGQTDPETLAEIEDFMRDEYRTLDHLSLAKFNRCARECWAAVQFTRTPEGIAYMAKLQRDVMGASA
jgi:hypothetical protein